MHCMIVHDCSAGELSIQLALEKHKEAWIHFI
jgi:hypothetical protein